MPKISQEELLKIARISHIAVVGDELYTLQSQLEKVLTYAERVMEKGNNVTVDVAPATINVMRTDVVVQCTDDLVSAQSVIGAQGYFVVPRVIEQK